MTNAPAKKKDGPNVIMMRRVRLNQFNSQLYTPEAELATKGKHKGKFRFAWSSKFILPPKDTPEGQELYKKFYAAMIAAKELKWGDRAADIKIKATNTPIFDGDGEDVTFAPYAGCYAFSASKTVYGLAGGTEMDQPKRPYRIIGPRKTRNADGELRFPDVTEGDDDAPYSGCFVDVKCELWGQEADGERGISARLNCTILAVQFAKHGDAFGGGSTRVNVDDDFDEQGDGYDDDGDDDHHHDQAPATRSTGDDFGDI